MAIPGQSLQILDPGLGLVETAPETPLYLGVSELGTNYVLKTFSNKADVLAYFGEGPLSEGACRCLDIAGGPVRMMKLAGSGGSNGAVTPTRVGSSTGTITLGGTANNSYELHVEILTTGSVASADFTFRYSLDDGVTFSEAITIPAAGTYAITGTGLTLTFVDGAGPTEFEALDLHEADMVADHYGATEIAAAATALLADNTEWAFAVWTGLAASASAAATNFASIDTFMTSMESDFRYVRSIMNAGDDTTANVQSSFAASTSNRISVCYGTADTNSSKVIPGWGFPKLGAEVIVGAEAADNLISTDLARVKNGPITGIIEISHDERATEELDVHRISTLRTFSGQSGFFITNARLKSAAGSDFRYLQHGRIMDVACATVVSTQQLFLSQAIRTKTDGTGQIDELDALRFEATGLNALRAALTQPINAEGTPGHVSGLSYVITRSNNVISSEEVQSTVALTPLGYAKQISTTIGFTLALS